MTSKKRKTIFVSVVFAIKPLSEGHFIDHGHALHSIKSVNMTEEQAVEKIKSQVQEHEDFLCFESVLSSIVEQD